MIEPGQPAAPAMLLLTLIALVALLAFRAVRKDRREYRRFKRFRSSARRQRMYRKWLIDSFVVYGGASVALLVLVAQFVPLLLDAVDGLAWLGGIRESIADSGAVGVSIAVVVLMILVVANVLAVVALRDADTIPAAGDILALLPRNRAELGYGAALSVNAGVVEEVLFRLALPALLFGITGNAGVSIAAAVLVFGALHIYQGLVGVVTSTVIGALLMAVYVATGSILAPIALHVLIDLRSLVLIPMVVNRVHRRPGDYAPPPPARSPASTSRTPATDVGAVGRGGDHPTDEPVGGR